MQLTIIVAVADNDVIGRHNRTPWHIPSDLKFFKRRTLNKAVIMGRKTLDSLGRPLPNRYNIVLTRDAEFSVEGTHRVKSFDEAVKNGELYSKRTGQSEILVVGGAQIYELALERADKLVLTRVHLNPEGDAYFPKIDPQLWEQENRQFFKAEPNDEANYTIYSYKKVADSRKTLNSGFVNEPTNRNLLAAVRV